MILREGNRLRASMARTALRTVLAACLLVVALAPSAAHASVTTHVGAQHGAVTFETYQGEVSVDQTLVPVDLIGRRGALGWQLGFGFASSSAEDWTGDGSLSGLADVRGALSRRFASDRILLSAAADIALEEGPYDGGERLLLAWVAAPELSLPLPGQGRGNRYRLDASARLLSTKHAAVFAGAFYEREDAFQLRDDGLELDPSDVIGGGLGIERGWGDVLARLQGFLEHPQDGQIDGADAWRLGDRTRLRAEVVAPVAEGEGVFAVDLLGVGSGELLPGWVLDENWARGGNRVDWNFGWQSSTPTFWGAGIGGTHVRGFTGALGHADWYLPHAEVGRRSANGAVRCGATYRTGSVREGRSLDGFELSVSWSREWRR